MKTRNGFVSNSSSSSFVVAFPFIPKTVDELKTLLFGASQSLDYYGDMTVDTNTAAQIIFEDMKKQKPNFRLNFAIKPQSRGILLISLKRQHDEGSKEVVLIDPGGDSDKIKNFIKKN